VGQLAQQMGRIDISDNEPPSAQTDGITAAEFRTAQQNDLALRSMWVRAETGNSEFCVINGLLYKRAPAHFVTTHEFLLVLPSSYIQEVIKLAHDLGGVAFRCEKNLRSFECAVLLSQNARFGQTLCQMLQTM